MALYSATDGGSGFKRQVMWLLVGLPVGYAMYRIDPRIWAVYSRGLYVLMIVLLLLPKFPFLARGEASTERWVYLGFFQFQPSEPAKLLLILTFADFLARWRQGIRTLRGLAISFAHILPAFGLVFLQPDLGTSLVFIGIWIGMSLVAHQRLRLIGLAILVGALFFFAAAKFGILRDYQIARVTQFSSGGSYQSKMALTSIGSGQGIGQGWNQGPLKESGLVPVQESDFIFTVIAEETGFIGSTLTVLAFGLFLWRVWLVVLGATVPLTKYMAAGIFVVLSFHTIVNLYMVMALFPVVGVPLPFISYGGSKMVLLLAMLGLLFNIRDRERKLAF